MDIQTIPKNIQPSTSAEKLEFHLQTGDYLLFVAYSLNFARDELEDRDYGSVQRAIELLKQVKTDLVYVNQRWVLVRRNVWGNVREHTTIVLASLFGKLFVMKKTKKEFDWDKGYLKKHGDSTDTLGKLNVDGFNRMIEFMEEQNKAIKKEFEKINKRLEKVEQALKI